MDYFVKRISVDQWNGAVSVEVEISAPTLAQLHEAIDAIDARTRTLVYLEGKQGSHLAIGGGNGKYMVYATTSDQQFWNLLSEKDGKGAEALAVGGKQVEVPARQLVDKRLVIQAAERFFQTGDLDASLHWELQP